jgi:hypothetical protein
MSRLQDVIFTLRTVGNDFFFFTYSTFATRSAWKLVKPFKLPYKTKQTPWPESASELYRPSDRRLSAKLLQTFADRRCHMASVTDPNGRIIGFQKRSRYFFFQIAPQLYSRGCVDPVRDPLLLRKSGSSGNRIWISGSVARNSDY